MSSKTKFEHLYFFNSQKLQVKKLDQELREAQNQLQQRDQTIKNNDKIIWLTKEKVAHQEEEIRGLHYQLDQLREEKGHLEHKLEELEKVLQDKEEEWEAKESGAYSKAEIEKVKNEYVGKLKDVTDQKNLLDGEVAELEKKWNDAKWR